MHTLTQLKDIDGEIAQLISLELKRQQNQIELIASENIVSKAVLDAQGSILTNKYAEGYPKKRYYGGCEYVDLIEELAINRAKQLFGCTYANVQPHSGSQANQMVMLALLSPGDTILGMSLASGGHLTHGATPNLSGKWFNAIQYDVDPNTHLIDYNKVAELAQIHKPKLIIAGGSAYPRVIDFAKFRDIANSVGAYLLVDMAHFAGLVAGGVHPSPLPYADVVTTTTHKTLRGPRGGMVLSNNEELGLKLNSALFPGLQGGPLMHVIAAKAIAFKEALSDDFKLYAQSIVNNAKALASQMISRDGVLVTGGTDSHLILVDLRNKKVTGKRAEQVLEEVGLTCNKNAIPFDPEKPFITSGIRLGTPAGTSRGFGTKEFSQIGDMIIDIIDNINQSEIQLDKIKNTVKQQVSELCKNFPIYHK
jgi:glycine hydroxymethyltransferase